MIGLISVIPSILLTAYLKHGKPKIGSLTIPEDLVLLLLLLIVLLSFSLKEWSLSLLLRRRLLLVGTSIVITVSHCAKDLLLTARVIWLTPTEIIALFSFHKEGLLWWLYREEGFSWVSWVSMLTTCSLLGLTESESIIVIKSLMVLNFILTMLVHVEEILPFFLPVLVGRH